MEMTAAYAELDITKYCQNCHLFDLYLFLYYVLLSIPLPAPANIINSVEANITVFYA